MVNGYKVVDFGGVVLEANAKKIDGIYKQISENVDKPILATRLNITGVNIPCGVFGMVQMNGTDYQITAAVNNTGAITQIIIRENDNVNIVTVSDSAATE